MKITIPEKSKVRKRDLAIYITSLVICILALIITIYVQFFGSIDISKLVGKAKAKEFGQKTEEEIELLKADFDKVFINSIEDVEEYEEPKNIKKLNEENKLVYTEYEKKESKVNCYDLEVRIPQINIDNEIVAKFNKEIQDVFVNKTNSVLESENKNIIYTVEYVATIEDDILFLMIRSNLKEGSSAQRVIIQTYNYDLKKNKQLTLQDLLEKEKIKEQDVEAKIKNTINQEQEKVEALKELGYNIYNRDYSKDMYKLENTTEFYLTGNTLYIIYAYGNETFTSEMDLVII